MKEKELKELSQKGGLNLLTAYIMSLTELEKDFAEDIAYGIYDELDEIIFEKASRYKDDDDDEIEFEI